MGTRTHQLPVAIPFSDNDLLPFEQADEVDRNGSLLALRTWLATRISPSLNIGTLYVDAVAGSDAADGLSGATAKKTIGGACAVLPVGAAATIKLKNGQTHYVASDLSLTDIYLTLNSWDGADHRADTFIEPRAIGLSGNTTFRSALIKIIGCALLIENVTLRTLSAQAFLTAYPAATANSAAFIWDFLGSGCSLSLYHANIILQDFELFSVNSDACYIDFSMTALSLTIQQSVLGAPMAHSVLSSNSTITARLLTNGVTLPAGKTWKNLLPALSYGGDLGPRNVLHNLGNALDSNQS